MYPCLLLKVLAEYDLQLCACSKRDSCEPVFLHALAKGYTPRLHLNVVAGLPGNGSFTQAEVPRNPHNLLLTG